MVVACNPAYKIRRAPLQAILNLRHRVLRAGLPLETAIFPGEDQPDKLHWAAYLDGVVVGCGTIHPSQLDAKPAFQLRGMAVEPTFQGIGIGREIILAIEEQARQSGISLLWANCRTPAVAFYQKMGWEIISDEFHVDTAGPHYRMQHRLELSKESVKR